MPRVGPRSRTARVFWSAMAALLVADAVRLAVRADGIWEEVFGRWVENGLYAAAAGACLARAATRAGDRLAWALLGLAIGLYGLGNVWWTWVIDNPQDVPTPSVADVLWLAFPPLVFVAMLLMVRGRVRRFAPSLWLDGVLGALAVSSLASALLFEPILSATAGDAATVVTGLAYIVGDLLLIALLAAIVALSGGVPGRDWLALGLGVVIFSLGDAVFLWQSAAMDYVEGGLLDIVWVAGAAVIGAAAWQRTDPRPALEIGGWRALVTPATGTVVGALVLAADHFVGVTALAVYLALATLAVAIARSGLTFAENVRLADGNRLALTDALTGLPNRRRFLDRVEETVGAAAGPGHGGALLVMDLDRFKDVNDTLGHAAGDELLRTVARRLRTALREGDTVARLGGDEYGVLLPDTHGVEAARAVARSLTRALEEPISLQGFFLDIEASVGIAVYPEHGDDPLQLVQRADVAMYVAKSARTGTEVYSEANDTHSPERLALIGGLRQAIANDEFVLHYQPKLDLTTGTFRSVEALVRWQHPDLGLISPGVFIPIAELTATISPLTLGVLRRALEQCARWDREGIKLSVSVNVSARHLMDRELPSQVSALLFAAGIDPERLELEITEETLIANPERSRAVLDAIAALGVRLSIDDFGVGYSSLNYLRRLPVHVLKIDRSFVTAMTDVPADAAIVRSTIELGHNLGMRVVAEGVESAETLEALRSLGCDAAQGYHLGRPIPGDDLPDWYRSEQRSSRETAIGVAPAG